MKSSPIWTATYGTYNPDTDYYGCYSVTWGQPDGQPIPANIARNLAEGFLREHRVKKGDVPALNKINYLYPYKHADLNFAYCNREVFYHRKEKK